jgi:hypothetical protein
MDILYNDLLSHLGAQVPELVWIDYDQGQIDFPTDSYPIDFPAVLIDFENVEWEDVGQNVQGGTVTISFRCAFRLYHDISIHTPEESRNQGLQKLQLLNKIHKALQGFGGEHYNMLSRVRQFTEKREDGLKVIVMQYETYARDAHALTTYLEHKVSDVEITKLPSGD